MKFKPSANLITSLLICGELFVISGQFFNPPVAEVFVTQKDSDEIVLLSDGTNKDIVVRPKLLIQGQKFGLVVLLCNATYPIEWIYEGKGAPRLYTTQIRSFKDFDDRSTYKYTSIVVLFQERFNEQQTGGYVCRSIEVPEVNPVKFNLYFPGEVGFPSLLEEHVQTKTEDTEVVIPCPTTDPIATISLFKVEKELAPLNLTDDVRVRYDPRIGFRLKISDFFELYGSYYCQFKNSDDLVKIELLPPKGKEVLLEPNEPVVQINQFSNHTFVCRGKEQIRISLPNTPEFGNVEYYQNYSNNYIYTAKLSIPSYVPIYSATNYLKISCITGDSGRILHTWELTNIGPEEVKVSYDEKRKRLLCCTKSGLTPIHEQAKCETVTDCVIKQNCFSSGRCEYSFPPRFVDAPRGCTAVQFTSDFPSHALKCSIGEKNQVVYVSPTVDNDDLIIYDGSVPPTSDILQIAPIKQGRGGTAKIRCLGALFYFSTNFVFAFEKNDGSLVYAEPDVVENASTYSPILTAEIDPDTTRVYCFAPLTRSREWRNVSLPIISVAAGSIVPYFAPAMFIY